MRQIEWEADIANINGPLEPRGLKFYYHHDTQVSTGTGSGYGSSSSGDHTHITLNSRTETNAIYFKLVIVPEIAESYLINHPNSGVVRSSVMLYQPAFTPTCFNCGATGHISAMCRLATPAAPRDSALEIVQNVKFCPNCGHPADAQHKFCTQCGSDVAKLF
jgi:hypothetical protein